MLRSTALATLLLITLLARAGPPEVRPPAAEYRTDERAEMVRTQMVAPRDGRAPILDRAVLDAMRAAPRHAFTHPVNDSDAYADWPLSIGWGQTISQPYIVALMTELLEVKPGDKILEIGTGSGYQAAVLGHLTSEVYTMEILEPLASRAASRLTEQGYAHVRVKHGDGYFGWPEHAPYDAIIVTCAAGHLPAPLWEQLAPGGRIVVPVGTPQGTQRLVVVEKTRDGSRKSRTVTGVMFVPMTGAIETR